MERRFPFSWEAAPKYGPKTSDEKRDMGVTVGGLPAPRRLPATARRHVGATPGGKESEEGFGKTHGRGHDRGP